MKLDLQFMFAIMLVVFELFIPRESVKYVLLVLILLDETWTRAMLLQWCV